MKLSQSAFRTATSFFISLVNARQNDGCVRSYFLIFSHIFSDSQFPTPFFLGLSFVDGLYCLMAEMVFNGHKQASYILPMTISVSVFISLSSTLDPH